MHIVRIGVHLAVVFIEKINKFLIFKKKNLQNSATSSIVYLIKAFTNAANADDDVNLYFSCYYDSEMQIPVLQGRI